MPGTVESKARAAGPVSAPAKDIERIGLCRTCNNLPTCVYREARGKDAIYCEMFDCSNGASKSPSVELVTAVVPEKEQKTKLKGLCVNCEHRHTCTLPKAESGVWHCEEYE